MTAPLSTMAEPWFMYMWVITSPGRRSSSSWLISPGGLVQWTITVTPSRSAISTAARRGA